MILTGTALILIAGSLSGLGILSLAHHYRMKKILTKELQVDDSYKEQFSQKFGFQEYAVVTVTLLDVLSNMAKIDPNVLKGIDHLHHAQNFDSLGDVVSFMKKNILTMNKGTREWRQMVHKYKGYTGEEAVFDKLHEAGHHLEVPDSGTMEGWDMKVDGQPMNVKITDNPKYIQEHLNEHPDIPVYTNSEMGHAFGDHANVYVDSDLSSQHLYHVTNGAMEGMHDLGNFIDHIPIITLTTSTIKNVVSVAKKDKDVKTAIEHVACDTAGVGVGGWLGGKVGLGLGLLLSPVTGGASAVVIPTITSVVGSILGIISGKGFVQWFKQRHLRKAVAEFREVAEDFVLAFKMRYHLLRANIKEDYKIQKKKMINVYTERENIFKRIFFPSVLSKFFQLAVSQSRKEYKNAKKYYRKLYSDVKKRLKNDEENGYANAALLLYAQGPNVYCYDVRLSELYEEVDEAVNKIEKERRKLT